MCDAWSAGTGPSFWILADRALHQRLDPLPKSQSGDESPHSKGAKYNARMTISRDALADQYLNQLPYAPYPVQEEALLAWFTAEQGVLVCAPTGMGKTLIAEAALFEALHTGTRAYYTTPLIALTEQKLQEMQV